VKSQQRAGQTNIWTDQMGENGVGEGQRECTFTFGDIISEEKITLSCLSVLAGTSRLGTDVRFITSKKGAEKRRNGLDR